MMQWPHSLDRLHRRTQERSDPVVERARHGPASALSLAGIGKRTRAEIERYPGRSSADWPETTKIPGRRTIVETKARRWRRIEGVAVDPVVEAPASAIE